MRDIYMRETKKGEVYWTKVSKNDRVACLIAYRYMNPVRTRYKIKYDGDNRSHTISVRKLLKEYPVSFSLLRDATGTRSYDI